MKIATLPNFGHYEEITNRFAKDISELKVVQEKGIKYNDIREVILRDGIAVFIDQLSVMANSYRETKRAEAEFSNIKNYEVLLLNKEQYITSLSYSLYEVRKVVIKAFGLKDDDIDKSVASFKAKIIEYHTKYASYFFEIDRISAIVKYKILEELQEKFPFRENEIEHENLQIAVEGGFDIAKLKTLEIIDKDNNLLNILAIRLDFFQLASEYALKYKEYKILQMQDNFDCQKQLEEQIGQKRKFYCEVMEKRLNKTKELQID